MRAAKRMVKRSLEEEIIYRKQIEQELQAKQDELTAIYLLFAASHSARLMV
jgi:hypothetical protein